MIMQVMAWLSNHDNYCYVITPKHVVKDRSKARVQSAAPIDRGIGRVNTPFWTGIDLAIIIITRGLEKSCTMPLEVITDARSPVATKSFGQLRRIDKTGQSEGVRMRFVETSYLKHLAQIESDDAQLDVRKGTSGAFLFVDDAPVGMALEDSSSPPRSGYFMRIEEIAYNVGRWVHRSWHRL